MISTFASAQGNGYWHTSNNRILDSNNQSVRISGVNWYGFETTDFVAHGLWAQDYKAILNAIRSNGYNTIRIPFSNEMVERNPVPSNISFNNGSGAINSDLSGKTALEILDRIVAYAGQIGLRVILDNHCSNAGNSAQENGLWYSGSFTESNWVNDWVALANRYKGNTTVIGADLRNEPHNANSGGACWGLNCGSANDWHLAAQRGGNAVLAANPDWLIFVEGTDCYGSDCTWWGGNLMGARAYPIQLNVANRLVYSAHDYGPVEYGQSWFNGNTTPTSLNAVWTKFWAYLSLEGTAPVWVGEFGTTNNTSDITNSAAGSQGQWFSALVDFLRSNPNISWTYWALNGEDRYGLLNSNYGSTPANAAKQSALASIQGAAFTTGSGGGGTTTPTCSSAPSTPASLAGSSLSASQIRVTWAAIPAPTNCSVTYSLYVGEGSAPAANATAFASGLTQNAFTVSGLKANTNYYFTVAATDAAGSSAQSAPVPVATMGGTTQVPGAPTSLTATANSTTAISLNWQASASAGATYNVYRSIGSSVSPAAGNRIASGVTGTSYLSSGLASATAYSYAVTAVTSAGESLPSNTATATTLGVTQPSGSCRVTYTVNSDWGNGFNVSISIQNVSGVAVNGWTLSWMWAGNQRIDQAWNSVLAAAAPNAAVSNAAWNSSIAAGTRLDGIGFNGTYSGQNLRPSAFYLNGTLCQ